MPRKSSARLLFIGTAIALLAVTLAGCAPADHLWLNAPEWSRATLVGSTVAAYPDPPMMDEAGNPYFVLAHQRGSDRQQLEIVSLDPTGLERWRQPLPFSMSRAVQPRLIVDRAGLVVLWIDDESLYAADFNPSSREPGAARQLSGDVMVSSFDVVRTSDGQSHVWFAGPRRLPGLYRASLDGAAPVQLDPEGILPDLEVGADGELHAFWSHYPSGFGDVQFFYGQGEPDGVTPDYAHMVVSPRVGPTSVLQGPNGAVSGSTGYVFWSVIERTGLSAGAGSTRYVSFPLASPRLQAPGEYLRVPGAYHLPYQALGSTGFRTGERVPLPAPSLSGTNYIADAWSLGTSDEAAVAVSTNAEYLRNKRELQVAVAYLRDGVAESYQLLSFTPAGSARPALVSDRDGRLYVTWLEKGEGAGFHVYFAGTSPTMVDAMQSLTGGDVIRVLADAAFGMLTGMLLAPLAALISVVAPLILLAITSFLRKDTDRILSPGTAISLLISLIAFWYAKIAMLPSIGDYVPFSAWVPFLPAWSTGLLRYGVPALTAVVGVLVAWALTYRRDRRSPVYFMLVYAAIDGLITGAMYGVQFYGAF
jgi:hypothetical protein